MISSVTTHSSLPTRLWRGDYRNGTTMYLCAYIYYVLAKTVWQNAGFIIDNLFAKQSTD